MSKAKKISVRDQIKIRKEKAMPEVKALVRKYGRMVIQGCLNRLFDYEKKMIKIKELKSEAAKLEKEIK